MFTVGMRDERPLEWLNIENLSKAWPFVVVAVYGIGTILLNFVYVQQWGVFDFNISNVQCTGAALWLAGTLALSFALDLYVDRGIRKLESVRISELIEKFSTLVHSRSRRQRLLTIILTSLAMLAVYFERPYCFVAIRWIEENILHLFRYYRVGIIVLVFYPTCILFSMVAMSFRKRQAELSGKEMNRAYGTCVVTVKIAVSGFVVWLLLMTFELWYLAIPARFGGGYPDPVLLWVSPSSLPILDGTSNKLHECTGSEFAIYKGLGLVHVGTDYIVLNPENSPKYIVISKDLVKRQVLAARSDPQTYNLFKEHHVVCVP